MYFKGICIVLSKCECILSLELLNFCRKFSIVQIYRIVWVNIFSIESLMCKRNEIYDVCAMGSTRSDMPLIYLCP